MKTHHFNYDISLDVEQLLTRAAVQPEKFRGKTIFVTGGTGFFGIWLLLALLNIKQAVNDEMRIIVLSRSPERFLETYKQYDQLHKIEYLKSDITTFRLNQTKVNYLFHMAATNASETYEGVDQLSKLEMLYEGTKNVLEQCGDSLENVLYTSSGVAYGINKSKLILESDYSGPDTLQIGSSLSLGKLVAEYLITYYAKKNNFSYSIARCFAFAGQYLPLDLHYAFGNFINGALNQEDLTVRGNGEDIRSYLYVADAVAWLLRLIAAPDNQIYNVGSEHAISIKALAEKVAHKSSNKTKVKVLGIAGNEGNFQRTSYIPSNSKIKENYDGIAEWTTIDEMISKMLSPLSKFSKQ